MYEEYFKLKERPFSLLPDPSFLYLGKNHRAGLTLLEYGLTNLAGFTVITGEIGSGKTTLIRKLLNDMGDEVTVGLISNTHESFGELLQWVLMAFGISYKGQSKVELFEAFNKFILNEYANNKRTILIIDEAQNASIEALEELRMLSNINADKDQILQMILVGQPEFRETLQNPKLIQFIQRISVHYHLDTLTVEDVGSYVRHRLEVAGGDPGIFEEIAIASIWYHSRGVPRLINTICDLAMVYAYAEQMEKISARVIYDVVKDRQVGGLRYSPDAVNEDELLVK